MPATEHSDVKCPLGTAFWSLSGAALVSNIGDGAAFIGFPVLASTLTRDPRLLAGVAVAQRLPWLLLSLFTGALADHFDRRRIMACVEGLRMVAVGALGMLIFAHFHPLAAIYLAAFTLGSLETAFNGASGAILPQLVSRSSLGRANGYLYAMQWSGEGIVGQAVGGLLAAMALSLPFFFDSATFAVSGAVLILALPRRSRSEHRSMDESPTRHGTLGMIGRDVLEGLAWFRGNQAVKLVTAFISGLAFCQAAVMGVLVLWAQRYLHVSPAGYGLLLTVATSGLACAAVLTGRFMPRVGPVRLLVLAGFTAGGSYLALAMTGSFPIAAAIMILESAAVTMGNVVSFTLRQTLIPTELMGRVGNAMRTSILGAVPAGALTGGLLAHSLGLRTMFVLAGVTQVVGVGLARGPLVRAIDRGPTGLGLQSDPFQVGARDDILDADRGAVSEVCYDLVGEALQPEAETAEIDLREEVLPAR